MNENVTNGDGMAAGLATADRANYLGDKATVLKLLRTLSGGTLVQFAQAESQAEVDAITDNLQGDCESVADILIGGLPEDYPPVEVFNRPGGIDVFVKAQHPEIPDTDPMQIVATALGMYLKDVVDYVKAVKPETPLEQWRLELDAITDTWANLFLGIAHDA